MIQLSSWFGATRRYISLPPPQAHKKKRGNRGTGTRGGLSTRPPQGLIPPSPKLIDNSDLTLANYFFNPYKKDKSCIYLFFTACVRTPLYLYFLSLPPGLPLQFLSLTGKMSTKSGSEGAGSQIGLRKKDSKLNIC